MEGGCGWVWVGGQVLLLQGGTTPDAHGLRGAVRRRPRQRLTAHEYTLQAPKKRGTRLARVPRDLRRWLLRMDK